MNFLGIFRNKNLQKKGFIKRGTRAELMWRDADTWQRHQGRHGPMRANVGAYVVQRNRAKLIGPTGIVGPGDRIGGRTRPSGRRKLRSASLLI